MHIFLTSSALKKSSSPQALKPSSPLRSSLHSSQPPKLFSSSTHAQPSTIMARTTNAPSTPRVYRGGYKYTGIHKARKELKELKELNLATKELRRATKIYEKLIRERKAKNRARSESTLIPESSCATSPADSLYADEDLSNAVVSLSPAPVKQEEQPSTSPFSYDFGSVAGSPAPSEYSASTPSTLDEGSIATPALGYFPSTGPSDKAPFLGYYPTNEAYIPGPSPTVDRSSFSPFFPAIEEPPLAGPSSTTWTASAFSNLALPSNDIRDGFDPSRLNEFAPLLSLPSPAPNSASQGIDWGLSLFSEPPSNTPITISESGPSTPAPPTPISSAPIPSTPIYSAPIYSTPIPSAPVLPTPAPEYTNFGGYNPGVYTQDLPVGLGNDQFAFNGVEAAVPAQQVWNPYQNFGDIPQPFFGLPALPTPALAPAPAPALAPAPIPVPAPAPVVAEQPNQRTGNLGHPHLWNHISQTFESDRIQAKSPLLQQNFSLPTLEQTLAAIQLNNATRGGQQPVKSVKLWF